MKNNVALIPARSGSKRVVNKNITPLNGHPLIAYSIVSAIESKIFDQVVVSTDSEEIKNISEYYGANVPFIRPSEYSQDKSPDILWVKHALDFFKEIKNYEFFSIIRPTSPFRKPETIKRAFKLFLNSSSVITFDNLPFLIFSQISKSLNLLTLHCARSENAKKHSISEKFI